MRATCMPASISSFSRPSDAGPMVHTIFVCDVPSRKEEQQMESASVFSHRLRVRVDVPVAACARLRENT